MIFLSGVACSPHKPVHHVSYPDILSFQVIDIIGPSVGSTRPLTEPHDVAVNMLGEIYIADYGNDRIVKLDSAGNYINEVGGFGVASYSLNGPVSLALDNVSNLYVVDSGNARLLRFDRNLNFISEENSYTKSEEINFINPTCIEVTPRGDVFVGDEGLGLCLKLDHFFSYIHDFASRGSIQPVGYPTDIACGDNNRIYVVDSEYGGVYIFDDFGLHIQTFGNDILRKPTALAQSSRSVLYVSDSRTGMVHCFGLSGKEIFRWSGQGSYQLAQPAGLFIDKNDIIYIVDSATSLIFIVKPILRR